MTRIQQSLLLALALLVPGTPATAQTYSGQKPRRQFVTISYDWMNTEPLHFASQPLEDLVSQPVASAQNGSYEYRSVGIFVADRSPGRGLGSQAFIIGGIGRIRSDQGDGTRLFAEGGGGLLVGPIGLQLAVKFAWNKLEDPVTHRFLTVPVTVRGAVSF